MAKIISTDKARQGHWGTQVLIVLVSALILVFIVWAGVGIYGQAIAPESTNAAPSTTQEPAIAQPPAANPNPG